MPDPFISVIIMAYNRKHYLKQAVVSVRKQSLDRSRYEVIVTSNFELEADDEAYAGMKHVYAEGSPGKCLSIAMEAAAGSVIAILDDDDLWEPERLSAVYRAFSDNHRLGYYHNNVQPVDEQTRIIDAAVHRRSFRKMEERGSIQLDTSALTYSDIRLMISLAMDFNNSSICFSRNILKGREDVLASSTESPDAVIFYLALSSDCTIYGNGRRLTLYRIHSQNVSTGISSSADAYLSGRYKFTSRSLDQLISLISDSRIVTSNSIERSLRCTIEGRRVESLWYVQGNRRKEVVKALAEYVGYMTRAELSYNSTMFLFSLVYIVSPRIAKWLYVRRFKQLKLPP